MVAKAVSAAVRAAGCLACSAPTSALAAAAISLLGIFREMQGKVAVVMPMAKLVTALESLRSLRSELGDRVDSSKSVFGDIRSELCRVRPTKITSSKTRGGRLYVPASPATKR